MEKHVYENENTDRNKSNKDIVEGTPKEETKYTDNFNVGEQVRSGKVEILPNDDIPEEKQ